MNGRLTRRDFLRTASGAAAVASFAAWLPDAIAEDKPLVERLRPEAQPEGSTPAAAGKKRNFKKAVGLGMVAGDQPILDKFKLLKDLGFDGVELVCPGLDVNEVLKARDATGLEVGNVVDSIHWTQPLSDPDEKVRAHGLDALKAALRDANRFGCKTVLLVPAVVNKQVSYADAYKRSQAEIRKAVPLARKLRVKIDIENVWNNFLLSPLEAARYVDEFKSEWVGWHFDVGNVLHYGWPEHWIRVLGKRIGNLHIKEFSHARADKQGKSAGFGVELLEGDCDWPAVMKALDDIGYHGWAIAEVRGGDARRLKDIAERMERIFTS